MALEPPDEADQLFHALDEVVRYCDHLSAAIEVAERQFSDDEQPAVTTALPPAVAAALLPAARDFWATVADASRKLEGLPTSTVEQLNAIGGAHWRPRCRHLLGQVAQWIWELWPEHRKRFDLDELAAIGMLASAAPADITATRKQLLQFQQHLSAVEPDEEPVSPLPLPEMLPVALQSEQPAAPIPNASFELSIEEERRRITRNGETADFASSALAWAAARLLATNGDRVTEKIDLFDLWETNGGLTDPDERHLRDLMKKIKKLLKPLGIQPQAARGTGYRLSLIGERVIDRKERKPPTRRKRP